MLRIIYRPRVAFSAVGAGGGGVVVPNGGRIPLHPAFATTTNDIELQVIHVNQVERVDESSKDGTTYECTRWTFDVICQYNPRATSYTGTSWDEINKVAGAGVVNTPPTNRLNQLPGRTDEAVRHFLMQKRGMLTVYMGGSGPLFTSPLMGYEVDCKYGPDPEFCNIIAVHGDKTLTIHYRITTWTNECRNRLTISPLLSNRWRRYVDTDEDHFSTIVTEGQAIFRVDELIRSSFDPDQFRQGLFHPIPDNCQRKDIHVEAIEDGTGVNYSFVDQELPFNYAFGQGPGITRVEAYMSSSFSMGNMAAELLHAAVRTARDTAYITAFGSLSVPLAISFATAGNVMQGAMNVLPRYGTHYVVRVWGNRTATRNAMMGAAVSYIFNIQNIIREIANCASEIIVTQEQHGKMIEIQANFTWGLENVAIGALAGAIRGLGGAVQAAGGILKAIDPFNPATGVFPGEDLKPFFTRAVRANPLPPNSGGTRGTLLEMVVAQVLSEPCTRPEHPVLTPMTTDVII